MPKVTGIVKVYVNGKLRRSKEGAKLITGGKERTPQVGHSLYGFSSKLIPATVEFTLAHSVDTDIIALNDMEDVAVKFETDVGVSYLVNNASTTKPTELTGGEGDVEVEMMGDPAVEE